MHVDNHIYYIKHNDILCIKQVQDKLLCYVPWLATCDQKNISRI